MKVYANSRTQSEILPLQNQSIDWKSAVALVTTGLVLRGALALCALLLPSRENLSYGVALLVVFAWRFVVHKAGVFPWPPNDLGERRRSSFSFIQATIDGAAFCILMLCAMPHIFIPIDTFIFVVMILAGTLAGIHGGWYHGQAAFTSSADR